jgi:hypothetical protein
MLNQIKKNVDLLFALLIFLYYVCHWTGKGERPLTDISEITLNITILTDVLQISVIAISILLPASLAIIVFLLKSNRSNVKDKEIIHYFFISSVLYFAALVSSIYNLFLIPQVADKNINISYHMQTMILTALLLLLVLVGTYRMIFGIYSLKEQYDYTNQNKSKKEDNKQKQEKKDNKNINVKIGWKSKAAIVCVIILLTYVFSTFYHNKKEHKELSQNRYLCKRHFMNAQKYKNEAERITDFNEKLKYINFAIFEEDKALNLKPIKAAVTKRYKKKFSELQLENKRIAIYKNYCDSAIEKANNSVDYEQRIRILQDALEFTSGGLRSKDKREELNKLIKKVKAEIHKAQYEQFLLLARKGEFKSDYKKALDYYYTALWFLENDKIDDQKQRKESKHLRRKIHELEKKLKNCCSYFSESFFINRQ